MSIQSSVYLIAFLFIVLCFTASECSREDDSLETNRGNGIYSSKEVAEKRPFFVGSRYGRSSQVGSGATRQVVPRNDRFFIGSRYGKRSQDEDGFPAIKIQTAEVTCIYTGVVNLYKCFGNVERSAPEEE